MTFLDRRLRAHGTMPRMLGAARVALITTAFVWLSCAAHAVIVVSAYFEALGEAKLPFTLDRLDRNDTISHGVPTRERFARLVAGLLLDRLPMPEPLRFAGRRLPASYANFYIANGLVLVPTFNDPNDLAALSTLAKAFPDHEVTGINCTELIWVLGALHCMTQQQPAAR